MVEGLARPGAWPLQVSDSLPELLPEQVVETESTTAFSSHSELETSTEPEVSESSSVEIESRARRVLFAVISRVATVLSATPSEAAISRLE